MRIRFFHHIHNDWNNLSFYVPPHSIEQICFDSTLTSEDYEKYINDLGLN